MDIFGRSNTTMDIFGRSNTTMDIFGQNTTTVGNFRLTNSEMEHLGYENTTMGVFGSGNTTVGVWGYENTTTGVWGYNSTEMGVFGYSNISMENLGYKNTTMDVFGYENTTIDALGYINTTVNVFGHPDTAAIFKAPLWQTHFPEALLYVSLTLFIIVVGTFGNIVIIIINLLDTSINNIGRIFIINIALGDLCVAAIAEPVCIIGVIYGEEWFDSYWFLCEIVAILCFIACIGSYLSFVLRTINRYVFLCHNHMYYDMYNTKRAVIACFICWIFAAIMDSANLVGWGDHSFDQKSHRYHGLVCSLSLLYFLIILTGLFNHSDGTVCVWDRNESFSYTMAIGAVLLIPLGPTVACFLLIFKEIFKRKMSVFSFQNDGNNSWRLHAIKESFLASRTLLIGFIAYVIMWAPAGVIIMIDFADRIEMQVYLFCVQLAHFHSCSDFIIDVCVDKKFRKNLYNLIVKRKGPANTKPKHHMQVYNKPPKETASNKSPAKITSSNTLSITASCNSGKAQSATEEP